MHRLYVHPLPVRIWHWTNALGFILMILTGIQIRYIGTVNVMPFKAAVDWHNWIGLVLIANFFIWLPAAWKDCHSSLDLTGACDIYLAGQTMPVSRKLIFPIMTLLYPGLMTCIKNTDYFAVHSVYVVDSNS